MPNLPHKRTLGVAEVARLLGCDATTVHRMIKRGELPAVKMPGLRGPYVIDSADVEAFFARAAAERPAS